MKIKFKVLPIAVSIASMAVGSATVFAADVASAPKIAAQPDTGLTIEEVVVTARKREENLQSVPVAITALSGEDLRANSVKTLEDLRFHAPSLQIQPSPFGNASPSISIRGQRPIEGIITLDPSVGVYFADVVWERPHGTNASMYDLASVQVLKGPQGTLFGRNTTGGAVLISPAKPSFDGVGGYVGMTIGNYNTANFTGMVNIPVSDTVAVRFAAQTNKHDGYTKVVQGPTGTQFGRVSSSRKDDADDQAFRASITIKPTAEIESTTVYQYFKETTDGIGHRLIGVNPAGAMGNPLAGGGPAVTAAMQATQAFVASQDWHTVVNDQSKGEAVETGHISNTTTWKLNDITLKNIIGWHTVRSFSAFDYDGSAVLLQPAAPSGPITVFNSQNELNAHQFSEEFQVLGNAFDNHLDWITGLYYFREMGNDIQRSDLFGRRLNDGTGENKSKSIFAQGTYKFESVQGLSLTAGARKTWDERAVDQHQQIMGPAATTFSCRLTGPAGVLNPCARHRTYKDDAPTWGLTLDYAFTPDTMAYVARRHGYKSGGLQLRANAYTEPATFDPEFVDDWELGLKSTFDVAGMPVRTNAAVYSQSYKDIQRTVSVATVAGLVTTVLNAGQAHIKGGELEVTVLPTKGLELSAFLTRTNAVYDTFKQAVAGGFQDVSGSHFAGVPRSVAGAGFKYELPLSSDIGKVAVRANWYRQSMMDITDINIVNGIGNGEGKVPGYSKADAFVDWTAVMGNPFDLRFYVRNLGDTKYATGGNTVYSTGFYTYALGAPRTYGLEFNYRFGTEK